MMNFNITIVKNDDFKTVGFHVYAEKKQIFSWGLASDMYYNKKIAVNPEHLDKVMANPEWTDVEHYNDIAVAVLSGKDKALIESIGISLVSEPDNNGFRHFKRFSELRTEINAFLKA